MKKAKNEILLMTILVFLFFIGLFYEEITAILSVFACLFNIIAKNIFSQKAKALNKKGNFNMTIF
ncbi:hypothetical protein DX932_10570 [Bacillus cereus]|uniref:Uncharacterized protein n=1 Tax=Bacillus cereus TaxID=1396 RepID=A0A9W7USA6_BACCE|nr:hypothetical protein [Bacillus cereus]KAA6470261.1 hypothetical protein DX932_10570 [Bacillus cereus]KAB2503891.1 hypothetical protein F8156_13005 [Bacillus cereus]